MKSIDETIATYFEAWHAESLEECAGLLRACCARDIAYCDPKYTTRGLGELAKRIYGGREKFPGHHVEVTSAIDGYQDTFRYAWVFVSGDGNVRLPGIDIVVRDGEGRIATLTSFFGPLDTRPINAEGRLHVQPPISMRVPGGT